jgi:acetyltransferase-like isoleucine patch superfamily enzyme
MSWIPTLRIGDRVNIEQGVHIVCNCEITIENDVSITPYCVIVDTDHPHDPPDRGPKIGNRLSTQPSSVHIGEGSFIGAHTVILPNVKIGKYCVIGAGSVVNKSIPDYCVAAGIPAKILSVFDTSTRRWKNAAENTG